MDNACIGDRARCASGAPYEASFALHWFLAATLAVALPCYVAAQQPAAVRQVTGNTLISETDPPVLLEFGKAFQHVGAQVIDIFNVAGAEQHFFVDAAPDSTVRRFYWVQFEHYYPTNQSTYDYGAVKQQPVQFGAFEFLGDASIVRQYFGSDARAGSDYQAAGRFLQAKGYKFPGTFARVRLFYLTDSTRRKELMVIYAELVPPGTSEDQELLAVSKHAQENLKVERRRGAQ